MNFKRLYNRVCSVMQWSIGFAEGNIEQVIQQKKLDLPFKWIPLGNRTHSIADPFFLKDPTGNLHILYEEFSVTDVSMYGKILLATLDKSLNVIFKKEILDADSHASYPFVWVENDTTYIIPETSQQRKVSVYEYDFANKCLANEVVIINDLPLLDSTIIQYNGKYWLFATLSKTEYDYSSLYIYYADSLLGKYSAHANNPVKDNVDGSRSAGSIITVAGELYRPAQNCGQHYGASIAINKITRLSENEFSEELYFTITPDKSGGFGDGIHTINVKDGVIVIDGIKMVFKPFTKIKLFLNRKFKKRAVKD